jgi:putative cell wall-binding protein
VKRLAPTRVFCIGLSTAVVNAVIVALPSATVIPINGANVYEMSHNVADALGTKVGDMSGATAIITRGDKFPDAIGVAPLACAELWPIILTDNSGSLHIRAAASLADLGITRTIKVGTYAPLPAGVTYANLSGADRYATNANVANWAKANAGLTFTHTAIATGDKFPDALAAGPYLAKDGGVLLLSPLYGPVQAPVVAVLAANASAVQHFTFIAMVEPVIGQVKALLP